MMKRKKQNIINMPNTYIANVKQDFTTKELLLQSEVNNELAPFVNTIGNIVWSRFSAGVFYGSCNGAFPSGKVWCVAGDNNENAGAKVSLRRLDNNTVVLTTTRLVIGFSGEEYFHEPQDDVLEFDTSIRIEVYP